MKGLSTSYWLYGRTAAVVYLEANFAQSSISCHTSLSLICSKEQFLLFEVRQYAAFDRKSPKPGKNMAITHRLIV
jgi:hypothetical protein